MKPGASIADRYLLEEISAEGGMGVVFRAWDRREETRVAVKILRSPSGVDALRFARECRLLARLDHPALVRYLDHGIADGLPYLAMGWIEGEPLTRRLSRGQLPIEESMQLVRWLAEGLEDAHRHGIVHRDIKPSNIMVSADPGAPARLIDFGIARDLSDTQPVTTVGNLVGTWAYMAPERIRGAPPSVQADLYALGVVLYECLAGRRMFRGAAETSVLARILLEDPPPVTAYRPDVPRGLQALVEWAIAKDPAGRPPDCRALIEGLEQLEGVETDGGVGVPAVLTGTERRVLSVVLARGLLPDDLTVPIEGLQHRDEAQVVRTIGETHGALVDFLPDMTAMLTVADAGAPSEQVVAAARCALALRDLTDEAVVSLATGLAQVAGRVPVGDLVDRAVALLVPQSDGLRIDEVTAGLLDARFDVQTGPEGYRLQREQTREVGPRTVLGRPAPFVGRRRELATLTAVLEECIEDQVARAVVVTGLPGVGKSRLSQEFLDVVREEGHVDVWLARGDPARSSSPFGMIADTVRRAAGLADGEPVEHGRRRLRALVQTNVPPADVDRVTSFLAELLGLGDGEDPAVTAARRDPLLMGDQLRRALLDLLSGACARRPVLLLLEDLHWGGRVVPPLVDRALRQLAERPLLVLALARPELHDAWPDLWVDHDLTTLRMSGLPRSAGMRLAQAVLGAGVPEARLEALVQRAGGNAFFLEELLRAASAGEWERLPETVLAMAQAPLSRVPPPGRRVLRAASVFGGTFWRGGVQALLGVGAERLVDEWLPVLVRQELLTLRRTSRFMGEPEYAFRHELVRAAAYGLLTEDDRALGHGLAAAWLEKVGEGDSAVLAEHYDLARAPDQAVRCRVRVAEDALRGNDFEGAVEQVRQAEAAGASGALLGALRVVQAEATKWLGSDREAIAYAEAALDLLPRGSDHWFAALRLVVTNLANVGDHARCAELAKALDGGDLGPWTAARAHASLAVSAGLFYAGQSDQADAALQQVEEAMAADVGAAPDLAARLHFTRGLKALMEGDVACVLEEHGKAANLFEAAGERRRAHNVRVNLGAMYNALGRFSDAIRSLEDAVDVADELGTRSAAGFARHNLGLALAREGRISAARAALRRAIADGQEQGNARLEGGSWAYLATISLEAGDTRTAVGAAERAIALLEGIPTATAYALATLSRATLKFHAGIALARAEEAMAIVDSMLVEEGDALARLAWVEALIANDREDEARDALRDALRRLEESAARVSRPEWRQSFLERIPEHARTMELARSWGI